MSVPMMFVTRRLQFLILATILLLCAAPPAGAVPVPLAPLSDAAPTSPAYARRQARYLEAETKIRRGGEWALAERNAAAKTANMDLYDVLHYDIVLALNPVTQVLTGSVTTTARVTGATLTVLDLHLRANMAVSAVLAGGSPTTFSRAGDVLSVDLDRAYATDEQVMVRVDYQGNPGGNSFVWSQYGGELLIWTLSEPFGARDWWPCKDLNTDKADSLDLQVTVTAGLIVASNGLLVSEEDHGATHTFHWHEGYPIATYLVSLAIHPYATFSDWYHYAPDDSMELQYYVVPDRLAQSQAAYAAVPDMLAAFAGGFGEYPFVTEKYGHAHFNWGGGMEHQTLTSLHYGAYSEGIISHELAHQWWGDLVTCADFHHIWLNEGFATWSEAYWREQNEGMAAYHDEMADAAYWGPGTIYVEDTSSFGAIFDFNLSYQKASWVVHMLRHVLGDTDFFAVLQAYRGQYGYGSATTEQFRDVCEDVSGQELDTFFQQWIYGEYFPEYQYAWYAVPAGDSTRVSLLVEQVQSATGLFQMPLDVRVTTDEGVFTFAVENGEALQTYALNVAGAAQLVDLDPEHWVLRTVIQSTVDAPLLARLRPRLLPAYPNPFNPATTVRFELPAPQEITLRLYDLQGRLVRTLAGGRYGAGPHALPWDGMDDAGRRVASGTYVLRLGAGKTIAASKLTLLK
jgi:aminopeptidase N